jgi:pyruvate dehydrogenase kinase 2/3/4
VRGNPLDTFTYVPAHIYFVASELIKNACAATVRFHAGGGGSAVQRGQGGLPPVKVIVVCGEHDVTIKVADEGGGIPRSKLADVWSYRGAKLSTGQCAAVPVGSDLIRAPEAAAGLGLALSRLHCKFFGGTLHLTPMEG